MDGCVRPLWLRQERSHKHEGDRQLRLAVSPGRTYCSGCLVFSRNGMLRSYLQYLIYCNSQNCLDPTNPSAPETGRRAHHRRQADVLDPSPLHDPSHTMLFDSMYDPFALRSMRPNPYGRFPRQRLPASPKPTHMKSALEPSIEKASTSGSYRVTLTAPGEAQLIRPSASIIGANTILLEGALQPTPREVYVYRAVRRAGLYNEPSTSALIDVLHPGSCIRGSAPSANGWIAVLGDDFDEDSLYLLDDGALELVRRPERPQPVRFSRRVEMPADAVASRATCATLGDAQGFAVTVPRIQPTSKSPPSGNASQPRKASSQTRATARPRTAPSPMPVGSESADTARPSRPKQKARPCESAGGSRDVLTTSEPVLVEVASSPDNVRKPPETVQHWIAVSGGGFIQPPGPNIV